MGPRGVKKSGAILPPTQGRMNYLAVAYPGSANSFEAGGRCVRSTVPFIPREARRILKKCSFIVSLTHFLILALGFELANEFSYIN